MKPAVSTVLLAVMATSLAGCGNSMRSYLEKDTPAPATMRADLTMPPDLRLPPPGTTAPAPDPGASRTETALAAPASLTTPPAAAAPAAVAKAPPVAAASASGPDSIYTQAGISLYNADGSKKTDAQLRQELQNYYMAQKKAKNPAYGTVFNIGNIFKDE